MIKTILVTALLFPFLFLKFWKILNSPTIMFKFTPRSSMNPMINIKIMTSSKKATLNIIKNTYTINMIAERVRINPLLASIEFSNKEGMILNKYCHEQMINRKINPVVSDCVTITKILSSSIIPLYTCDPTSARKIIP